MSEYERQHKVEIDRVGIKEILTHFRSMALDEPIRIQVTRAIQYDVEDIDEARLIKTFPKREYCADLFEGPDEETKDFRATVANASGIKPFIDGKFTLSKYYFQPRNEAPLKYDKPSYGLMAWATQRPLDNFTISVTVENRQIRRFKGLRGWSKDMAEFNTGRKWEHVCPRCGKRCNFKEVLFGVLCRDCYKERC